jgi:hypothetical protein
MRDMTNEHFPSCGTHAYDLQWGPFHLVSILPVTLAELDANQEDAWCSVGLLLDPPALGNDYHRVLRELRAFLGYVASITGWDWTCDPARIAAQIHAASGVVRIPFWQDLDASAGDEA